MTESEIATWVKANVAPLSPGTPEETYRCAAFLRDGLFLPCVAVRSRREQVALAIRRFAETREDARRLFTRRRFGRGFDYPAIVETFVTAGNHLNHYDIASLASSDFALPVERLQEVRGETSMSWTQFVAEMHDGSRHSFGTTFLTEFFQMPAGYVANDIVKIHAHERLEGPLYRERPFFVCFVALS